MKSMLLSAVLALSAATPALAQADAGASATAVPPSSGSSGTEFVGFRLEGDIGGDRFRSQGAHRNKLGYGGTIGFDGRIGTRIIVGPEASFWRADNWSENCTGGVIGGSVCHKSFEEYGAAVRAGLLVSPNLLVFGKGGYVTNEQRKRFDAPARQTGYYNHFNTDGYQVGGGVELSMANRFSGVLSGLYVNGQYVYSRYDDHTSRQRVFAGIGVHFK